MILKQYSEASYPYVYNNIIIHEINPFVNRVTGCHFTPFVVTSPTPSQCIASEIHHSANALFIRVLCNVPTRFMTLVPS
jgi:hypothetical protein